jgi:tetratricopeptide (TPR) repeat protein
MKKSNQTAAKKLQGGEARQPEKFSMNPSILRTAAIFLCFAILGFLLYSNTFESPFVFDDNRKIVENQSIRITELSAANLIETAFGKESPKARPISNVTFALNYYFHQYNVEGYHLVNIVIHILAGMFLFIFIQTTLTLPSLKTEVDHTFMVAFFAALLWLVHPIQTQSVTYIVQRMNSMAALFYILAFWLYVKGRLAAQPGRKWGWFGSAALAWIFALGSKQNAATLPFFVFLYEWYFFQDLSPKWFKSSLKYIIAVAIIVATAAFLYLGTDPLEKISKLRDFSHGEFTLAERALTQTRVVVYYLSLIFFPHPARLNLDHDFPLSHSLFNPPTTLLALILIIGLIALAIYLSKRERLISFCILWFFGNLVIESSVIPLAIIFEHRTYLPSMLLFLIPITLGYRHIKFRGLKIGLLSMVVVIFAVWTYQRNQVWENELTLWADVVKKSPDKARPHLNLGETFSKKGSIAQAAQQYRQALRINPRYAKAYFNLANVLQQHGSHAEAIKHYSTAIQIEPGFTAAHNNLGLALVKEGKRKEAIKHYLEILKIDPTNAKVHSNIGVALTELGETDQAISHFQQALDIDPADAETHYNLAIALEIQQRYDEALNHYLAALERNPEHALAHFNAANIFAQQRKINEAVRHYEKSIAIQPDSPRAINNLALMYAMQKNYTGALSRFKEVLRHWPEKAETYYNVACMYSRLKKKQESIEWLQKAIDRGYSNWESIKSDSDLENIRDADAYRELVKGH